MKKQLLLLACIVVLMASCSNSNNNNDAVQKAQAQIDSAVNAKVARHDAENAAKNDSTLKALAKQKADTMEKEQELQQEKEKKH
jgi:hypothetical protein